MELFFKTFSWYEILLLMTFSGIGQIWHRFQKEIKAIHNTKHFLIQLVANNYSLLIWVDIIFSYLFYGFLLFMWYDISWSIPLLLFIFSGVGGIVYVTLYNNIEYFRMYIETFFFFIFWLRPISLIFVILKYFMF